MTRGEYIVGIDFNPSNDDLVGKIKRAAADFIDLLETIPCESDDVVQEAEKVTLKDIALRTVEDAAMYGVKAVTKGEWK